MAAPGTPLSPQHPAPGTFAALAQPEYRRFWTGSLLSNLGNWMQSVAQGWLVLQLTDSPLMLGVVGFANTLPSLLFTLIGGVLADRFDRRRTLLIGQSVSMLAAFAMATLVAGGWIQAWHVIVLAFVAGLSWALTGSSFQALVGDLGGRELRGNAIALNSTQFHLSRAIGPSVAGLVLASFGAAICFYINATSYLFVIYALVLLGPRPPSHPNRDGAWVQLKAGITYAAGQRPILTLLAHTVLISGLGMPVQTLLPVMARDVLQTGATGLGHLMTASGAGAVLGALVVARLHNRRRRGLSVIGFGTLYALALIGLARADSAQTALLLLFVAGFLSVSSQATVNTLLQTLAPDELRGRVMSMYSLAFIGILPLGNLFGGWLAQAYGTPTAIGVLGTLMLVGMGTMAIMARSLRTID